MMWGGGLLGFFFGFWGCLCKHRTKTQGKIFALMGLFVFSWLKTCVIIILMSCGQLLHGNYHQHPHFFQRTISII